MTRAGCKGFPKHPARSFTQEHRAQGQLPDKAVAGRLLGLHLRPFSMGPGMLNNN
nr:MAG TPA: hypothetical protein [Caudoviricetes sp.]